MKILFQLIKAFSKYPPVFTLGLLRFKSRSKSGINLFRTSVLIPFLATGISTFPQVAQAQNIAGCPAGTAAGTRNYIVNGTFATPPGGTTLPGVASFTSDLPYRGNGVYPDDPGGGGISIQTGSVNYSNGIVIGNPFPGDPSRGSAPTNTYLYSNPNLKVGGGSAFPNPLIWQQTVTGLQPNRSYRFTGYFYNLLSPTAGGVAPIIVLRISSPNGTVVNSPPIAVTTRQQWIPVEFAFTTGPGQTSATLWIFDQANDTFGDDFGLTATSLSQCGSLGVAKAVGTPVANPNGTFTVPYTVAIRNFSTDPLSNVQLTDNLTTTFANAAGFVVSNVQSPTLAVNSAYDGRTTNPNLLAPNNTLPLDGTATVTFNVTITPGTGPQGFGPFDNSVRGTATTAGGAQFTDDSVNGTDTDPDGDGNPTNNTSPTRVSLTPTARLGVAKAADVPTINNDGTFTVPYTVTVRNVGNTILNNVQVTENLAQTFTGATAFSVVPNSITGTGVRVNNNFNGIANSNLLAGSDSLAVGASATITFRVLVTPGTNLGPYNNTAVGNAIGPNETPVTDQSTNGANVDPDGDGDPTNNSVPTPVTFAVTPRLGVAKAAGTPTNNNDGSFSVPYTIIVRNVGNTPLSNLQVTENLTQTFAGATAFSILPNSVRGTGVTVNNSFNGTSNSNLLAGSDSLAVGANATINFTIRVTPGTNFGPYNNIAVGNAIASNGTAVTDQSTNGANVDPDGNGDPGNDNVPTVVNFIPSVGAGSLGNLRLIKRITAASRGGAPIGGLSFTGIDADTDANAVNQAGLRPIGVRDIPATSPLRSGDEVEYTIYFLSDGTAPATDVNFCDLIPTGTTYVSNSTSVQVSNAQLSSAASFINPLNPLPTTNSCLNQTNANGAVIVNLGNVSNSAGNNFGLIRLRVRIN